MNSRLLEMESLQEDMREKIRQVEQKLSGMQVSNFFVKFVQFFPVHWSISFSRASYVINIWNKQKEII